MHAVQCVMSRKFWPSVLRVSQTLQFGPVFLFVACRFTSWCLFKCPAHSRKYMCAMLPVCGHSLSKRKSLAWLVWAMSCSRNHSWGAAWYLIVRLLFGFATNLSPESWIHWKRICLWEGAACACGARWRAQRAWLTSNSGKHRMYSRTCHLSFSWFLMTNHLASWFCAKACSTGWRSIFGSL